MLLLLVSAPCILGLSASVNSGADLRQLNVRNPTSTGPEQQPADSRDTDLRGQVAALRRQNEALHQAVLDLVSELSTSVLLQKIVDRACGLTRAQYGALAVLGPDGEIEQFLTSGLSTERRARVGSPPQGHGVLGLLNQEKKAIRVGDISKHPRSVGFPKNHPPMRTFLGVPVPTRTGPFGNLYLTEKLEGLPFTEADEEILTTLANFAAVAIANSRLHQLRESIVSLVSHELRTPLSHIKGFASSLLQTDVEWDSDAQRDFLDGIVVATERMARLVDDILDLARLETGGQAGEDRRPSALDGPLRAGIAQGRAFFTDHRLRVQLPDKLPLVFAEPGQIERVLTNLVENAAKYSPPGTPISVQARTESSGVVVTVADRGPGISLDQRERIFEKFVRLPRWDGPSPPGTGLGLTLCKTLVEAHGGRIWVEPRRGGGSRFVFTLPVSESDRLEQTPPA